MIIRRIYLVVPSKMKKDAKDAPLRLRIKWNESHDIVSLNVGYRVSLDRWDPDQQRCSKGSYHGRMRIPADRINREIDKLIAAADKAFSEFETADREPTEEDLRQRLRQITGSPEERRDPRLPQMIDEFCSECGHRNAWTKATYQKFVALKGHLLDWRPSLRLQQLDEAGLSSWTCFLRDRALLRNSTIVKQLGFLRWFLRWAEAKGYGASKDYALFRPKLKTISNRVVFLSWDELMRVWDADLADKPSLARVRDVFCFCATTSLRYSDAMHLRWSNVKEGSISITTVKTSDTLSIELNKWSQEILCRYVDEPCPDGHVFYPISNQRMNDHLKEVCRIAGLDEPITRAYYLGNERREETMQKWELVGTHTARRTFICNALTLGIPPNIVMRWTGHSSYSSMRPYIDIADAERAKAMTAFDHLPDGSEKNTKSL